MSSFESPFFDGSRPEFEVNRNAWFSYYTKGAGVALYLDLFIRGHTNNRKSLDNAFRLLRDRTWGAPNASYYLQGRGYTEEDVVQAASDAAGVDMHAWFDRFVGGTDDMDYDTVLAAAGMKLTRDAQPTRPDGTSSRAKATAAESAFAKDGERKTSNWSRVDELAALADRDHRDGGENDPGGASERRLTDSPAIAQPRNTATSGFTYAYVDALAGETVRNR
jgi:hypothetical protein